MGQKCCPISFRISLNKKWRSMWYANKQEFGKLLVEDQRIRKHLMAQPACTGVAKIEIQRMSDKVQVIIHSARPGLLIGKKGSGIDVLRQELSKLINKEVWVDIIEVKKPDLSADLVAEGIAKQLERRMPYRRVIKKAIQTTMGSKAKGVKIKLSGRIGGAEIARSEWYKDGRIPLHTLRADIDYGTATAHTTYGALGLKVWINLGENLGENNPLDKGV